MRGLSEITKQTLETNVENRIQPIMNVIWEEADYN